MNGQYEYLSLTIYFKEKIGVEEDDVNNIKMSLEDLLGGSENYSAEIYPEFAMFWYLPREKREDIRGEYEKMCHFLIEKYNNIKNIGVGQNYWKPVKNAEQFLQEKIAATPTKGRGVIKEQKSSKNINGLKVEQRELWQAMNEENASADHYTYSTSLYTLAGVLGDPSVALNSLLQELRAINNLV